MRYRTLIFLNRDNHSFLHLGTPVRSLYDSHVSISRACIQSLDCMSVPYVNVELGTDVTTILGVGESMVRNGREQDSGTKSTAPVAMTLHP